MLGLWLPSLRWSIEAGGFEITKMKPSQTLPLVLSLLHFA